MNWMHDIHLRPAAVLLFVVVATSLLIGCSAVKEHDVIVPSLRGDMKCTCSPCGNPCGASAPPPPPPSPPPPSPPKSPSTSYCPPPPPPSFSMYGPPGNLYPLDPNYYIAGARRSGDPWLPVLVGCVVLALCEFWWV